MPHLQKSSRADLDMTSAATSPANSTSVKTVGQSAVKSYIFFTIWAALYILPLIRLYLVGTDEGTLDVGAVRVFQGQVFARDFFEVMGPGTFYWVAGFFKLFGVTFLATRICLFLTSMGTALLMYFLSRRLCRTNHALPAIILGSTVFPGLWPAISHHNDSMFFGLLAVACMVLWQDLRRHVLLFAAGTLAALTTTFLQPKGLFLFIAFLAWLTILRWRKLCSLSGIAIVASGYLLVLSSVVFYFWTNGALGDLIYDNFTWPSHHYGTVNAVGYGHGLISNYLKVWIINQPGLRWTIALAAFIFVPLLFITVLPALLAAVALRFRRSWSDPIISLYWLCGIGIWLSEVHRPDVPRLIYGSPLLIILCVYFWSEYETSIPLVSLRILSISAIALATFNVACTLAAEHTIPTRVGTVRMLKEAPVIAFLNQHVAPSEEIFAYPYCPRYYFLTATTNPTPYSILMYNYNTSSEFENVIRILEQRKVKYVVWDSNFYQGTMEAFPGSSNIPASGEIIEPYLVSRYRLVELVGGMRIMERRPESEYAAVTR